MTTTHGERLAVPAIDVDVVVVGAGFAGLRALRTFRDEVGMSAVVLEASDGIGGVWHHNRYPGARCDVESYDYSYAFSEELEQEWRWSERYATQPEILEYVHHVAERFDLHRDIRLQRRVVRAAWDDHAARWTVEAGTGEQWRARFLVMAVGQLSTTKRPEVANLDAFTGEIYHTAEWPQHPVDLRGKRVGIIGTGSSCMQMVPVIADDAAHVVVFQRTANFSVPARNAPITDEEDVAVKATYRERREKARNSPTGLGFVPNKVKTLEATPEEREALFEEAWNGWGFGFALVYPDILLDEAANEAAAEFIRRKIREKVRDPQLAEKLTPRGFPFATKRPSVDSGWFEAFNRDDVELVDICEHPIEGATPDGLRTAAREHALDVLVFATGFDALTGSLLKPEIVGRGGVPLRERWVEGPQTYLGLGVAGFPNMFIVAGPQSPGLLSNVLLSIEHHVDWIAELLTHLRDHGFEVVEATEEAERDWVAHVAEKAAATLYPKARSYYMGDEVEGKPRVFMPYSGGVRGYRRICEQVVDAGYKGWSLRRR